MSYREEGDQVVLTKAGNPDYTPYQVEAKESHE
jgi:hypothetical protein